MLQDSYNGATTVEPVYYGHPGTNQRCPDYQGVLIFQVSLSPVIDIWDGCTRFLGLLKKSGSAM